MRIAGLAVALLVAGPALAQTRDLSEAMPLPSFRGMPVERALDLHRGFSFPVDQYQDQVGVRQERRGIIAGRDIMPGMTVGLGFFQTTPKSRTYAGDQPLNGAPKRTKRAAVGLSMKF